MFCKFILDVWHLMLHHVRHLHNFVRALHLWNHHRNLHPSNRHQSLPQNRHTLVCQIDARAARHNFLVVLDNWHPFLQHGRHVDNPVNAFEVVAQRIFCMCGAHFCTVADTSTILSLTRTNGFCTVWDREICLCTATKTPTVPHTDLPKCCCAKVSRQLCRPDCRKKSLDCVSNFHKRLRNGTINTFSRMWTRFPLFPSPCHFTSAESLTTEGHAGIPF